MDRPGVLEKPEGQEEVLIESPTGIAYGISGLILSSLASGLDDLVLMGCLMGPKSFLKGLKELIANPLSNYCVVIYDFEFLRSHGIFNCHRVIVLTIQ